MTKLLVIVTFLFSIPTWSLSQNSTWSANLAGNGTAANTNGSVSITSSIQSVDGGNPQFIQYNNYSVVNDFNVGQTDINATNITLSSVSTAKRLRAQAGVPFTITINTSKSKQGSSTDLDNVRLKYGIGKNEQPYRYDVADYNGSVGTYTSEGNPITQRFTITHTFAVGRTEAWIVLELYESAFQFYGLGSFNTYAASTSIVIPIVIEGPTAPFVNVLGTTTQPKIPYMVLHQPPGSQSSSSILSTQKTCRNFEETFQKEAGNSARGAVKIGYKGSLGIIASVDSEIFARFSAGSATNDIEIKTNSNETCVEVTNNISTVNLASANNAGTNGDLFIGYGVDLEYGISRAVSLQSNTIVVDTGLVYAPVAGTMKQFVLTKAKILEEIAVETAKVSNLVLSDKERATAEYQIDAWNKTLQLNENNIAQATDVIGQYQFSQGSNNGGSSGIDYSVSTSIDTKKYFESNVGFDFLIEVAGSGFSGGFEWTSRSTYGIRKASSSDTGTLISYAFQDDDEGDVFNVAAYRDPMFGSPVFKMLPNSKSSCPHEPDTEQLDKPRIEIIGSATDTINIENVSIDASAAFLIKLWNDSSLPRSYQLSFADNPENLLITANGSNGTQNLNSPILLSQNAGSNNYTINVTRPNSTAATTINNVKLILAPSCDPSIGDTISMNISWSVPPLPTNVAVSKSRLCTTEPVTLSASCFIGNLSWWDNPDAGSGNKLNGVSPTFTPIGNVVYYASCDGVNYLGQRVAAPPITIAEQGPNLTFSGVTTTNKFAVAVNTIEGVNKINSPTNVLYKAGKSITLNQGFEAKSGSTFEAEIGGCVN